MKMMKKWQENPMEKPDKHENTIKNSYEIEN